MPMAQPTPPRTARCAEYPPCSGSSSQPARRPPNPRWIRGSPAARPDGRTAREEAFWSMLTRREFMASTAAAVAGPFVLGKAPSGSVTPQAAAANFDPWLEVDAGALAHNARTASRLAGGKPVIAVAKNNAYGLGLETAGPLLDRLPEVQAIAV